MKMCLLGLAFDLYIPDELQIRCYFEDVLLCVNLSSTIGSGLCFFENHLELSISCPESWYFILLNRCIIALFVRERESLLAQILNNFIHIKTKALGHRKKLVKQVVSSGAPRQFHKFLLWCKFDGRIIANLLRLLF